MKHSPKRECVCRCLGVRCWLSSRHGQFHFPVFASGLIVIIFGNGTFAPSRRRKMRPPKGDERPWRTSYQGNVTSLTQSGQRRRGCASHPNHRPSPICTGPCERGWEDFKAVPSHAIILCVIYPVLGLVLARAVLGYSVLPLLFPLAAGFALLGPFAALGLYEMSRRRETRRTGNRLGCARGAALAVVRRDARARRPPAGAVRDLGGHRAGDLHRRVRL